MKISRSKWTGPSSRRYHGEVKRATALGAPIWLGCSLARFIESVRMRPTRILLLRNWCAPGLILFWAALAVTGCGDGKIARYPVQGKIAVDGKPAEGALVIFCPVEGPPELMRERPYGRTDAQGVYELRTLEPGDGAPAGNYNVMVRWIGGAESRSDDRNQSGGDRLNGRYTDPAKSGLSYTVVEGDNEVPQFDLKTR
jgi:hypothetical protein